MNFVYEGLFLGLSLSMLLGPIFVALTETTVNQGARKGLYVGLGIWISDLLVILAGYFLIKRLDKILVDSFVHEQHFKMWFGTLGGLILCGIGGATFLKSSKPQLEKVSLSKIKTNIGLITKGFSINFFNPFTFIFWFTTLTTYVVARDIDAIGSVLVFGTILVTIMITDTLKILLAHIIKSKLKPIHIDYFTKTAGAILMGFGIVLIIKSYTL